MPEINMPKLSDTMEEGTVLEWKKETGQEVRKGEAVAEIESDKASFDIEAEADGILSIIVERGRPVPVGQRIGWIGKSGEAPPDGNPVPAQEASATRPAGAQNPSPPSSVPASAPSEKVQREALPPRPTTPARGDGSREKVSPLARRLARDNGVDLGSLTGSGPDGRIVKEDVLAAVGRTGTTAAQHPRPARPAAEVEIEEPTRMQATISRRMVESKTTVPHFYATMEVRVDEAVRLRQQLKATVPAAEKLTMTDILVRACALALARFPEVNASWVEGRFERKRGINIGLAVPPASGLGLLVPVIHDCEHKDLVQISIESRQVIERARSGKPGDGDLSGGTFSISNLGMYGVDEFNAIINPPESAILAVGAIKEVPVVDGGQIKVGSVMRLTLSVDHRVFYGQTAALFLAEVKRLLEAPVSLVLPPEPD